MESAGIHAWYSGMAVFNFPWSSRPSGPAASLPSPWSLPVYIPLPRILRIPKPTITAHLPFVSDNPLCTLVPPVCCAPSSPPRLLKPTAPLIPPSSALT